MLIACRDRAGSPGFLAVLLSLAVLAGCDSESGGSPALGSGELLDRIQELYETARNAGDDVPSDAYEWAKSDLQRIGDWEYRIVRLDAGSDVAVLERLNELGAERWEVFWLERDGDWLRVFLKRHSRSYLRLLPLSDLGRLVPTGQASE